MKSEDLKSVVAIRTQVDVEYDRKGVQHRKEFLEYKFRFVCNQCHRTFFVWSRKKVPEQLLCEECKKRFEVTI